MTGTDAFIPTNIPGYAIHDELWDLVEIGLTPYEALMTATTHPMMYLGELEDGGTLEVGKRSDLILLEANPLEIITNTRSIIGVMSGQKWLNRDDLQTWNTAPSNSAKALVKPYG